MSLGGMQVYNSRHARLGSIRVHAHGPLYRGSSATDSLCSLELLLVDHHALVQVPATSRSHAVHMQINEVISHHKSRKA